MNTPDHLAQLNTIAEGVVRDVSEMVEGKNADLGYNLYVEDLDGKTVGLIDMGDLYQGTFEYGPDGWWQTAEDPFALEDRILAKRGFA